MSISDTIQEMIMASQSAAQDMPWFLAALPAIASTEVMGSNDTNDADYIIRRQQRKVFAEQYQEFGSPGPNYAGDWHA